MAKNENWKTCDYRCTDNDESLCHNGDRGEERCYLVCDGTNECPAMRYCTDCEKDTSWNYKMERGGGMAWGVPICSVCGTQAPDYTPPLPALTSKPECKFCPKCDKDTTWETTVSGEAFCGECYYPFNDQEGESMITEWALKAEPHYVIYGVS